MEENKNTIIIASVVCVLLVVIILATRGCSKKQEEKRVIVAPQKFIKNEEKEIEKSSPSYSYSGGSSGYSSGDYGDPPALLTEEDKKELAKNYEEDNKVIATLKKEWMENKLSDPNLNAVAREQFKLRSNPAFANGMKAFEKEDYAASAGFFNEILKDPNTSPVSKYFACMKLMDIAMKKKDLDLYFMAANLRASLEEKEDLELLGIVKSSASKNWIKKLEYTLRAKKDPSYFQKCVELKLAKTPKENTEEIGELLAVSPKGKDYNDEKAIDWAKDRVKKEIEFYSDKYKDLLE